MKFESVYPVMLTLNGPDILVNGASWKGGLSALSFLLSGLKSPDLGIFADRSTKFALNARKNLEIEFSTELPPIEHPTYLQTLRDRVDHVLGTAYLHI
jgi:hypothetical protein